MAKKKTTTKKPKTKTPRKPINLNLSRQGEIILGSFLFFLGVVLLFAFASYLFTGKVDQNIISTADRNTEAANWLSIIGAKISYFFMYKGFGIAAFILAGLITISGVYYFFNYAKKALQRFWFWGILLMIWLAVFFGFFYEKNDLLGGTVGYEINDLLQDYLGLTGAIIVMAFLAIVYAVLRLKATPEAVGAYFKRKKKELSNEFSEDSVIPTTTSENSQSDIDSTSKAQIVETKNNLATSTIEDSTDKTAFELNVENLQPTIGKKTAKTEVETPMEVTPPVVSDVVIHDEVKVEVEASVVEDEVTENLSDKLVKDFGEFDPTLELGNYKYPPISLLKDYTGGQGITINQEELEENKNRIVETLNNLQIGRAHV